MVLNISNILNQSIHKAERVRLKPKRLIVDIDEKENSLQSHQISTSLSLEHRQLSGAIKRSREQLQTFGSLRGSLSELRSKLDEMKELVVNHRDSPTLISDLKELNSKMNQLAKTSQLVEQSSSTDLNINSTSGNSGDII